MKKSKKSPMYRVVKYLRELSIVVLGVFITLFLSGKISEINEKRDLRLQMHAVRMELEDNLASIDRFINYYTKTDSIKRTLESGSEFGDDALHILGQMQYFNYKKDALDMLKNTGYLRLVKDKQQLLDILECYRLMDLAKEDNYQYMYIKTYSIFLSSDFSIPLIVNRLETIATMVGGAGENFEKSKYQITKVLTYEF